VGRGRSGVRASRGDRRAVTSRANAVGSHRRRGSVGPGMAFSELVESYAIGFGRPKNGPAHPRGSSARATGVTMHGQDRGTHKGELWGLRQGPRRDGNRR